MSEVNIHLKKFNSLAKNWKSSSDHFNLLSSSSIPSESRTSSIYNSPGVLSIKIADKVNLNHWTEGGEKKRRKFHENHKIVFGECCNVNEHDSVGEYRWERWLEGWAS